MAVYSNLPVFKASYDLLIECYELCNHLKRDYRYTIGEKLKNILIEMMINIYKANQAQEKAADVERCRQQMVEIKLYLRLLHDLKQLSVRRFALLSEKTENITKQLNAWHKTQLKNGELKMES